MNFIVADSIKKYFSKKKGIVGHEWLKAVDGVSFSIERNRVFSLVGESGCGKSTVAKLLLRLIPLTDGRIYFKGEDISNLKGERLKEFRRSVQIIFQDPFASLNPRMRIGDILSEPFRIHKTIPVSKIKDEVDLLICKVGLTSDAIYKYPHEFSGGQRQRICIARALALSPELIVADEPLSALDVSVQAQIINLFLEIKKETEISIFFISHDLRVVRYLSDEVAVMYSGKIVEMAGTEEIFEKPKHPYTRLLLSSVPKIRYRDKDKGVEKGIDTDSDLKEERESQSIITGCSFYPRCPKRIDICSKESPILKEIDSGYVACHLY
jgi:oligopeptide/dipeptide ABC transporter ATP-binding protein